MAPTSASAEGDIARTPFAHLLIYALDRALSGAIFLTEPGGVEHTIQLVDGVPIKARPGDGHALLGEMLVEAGAIDRAKLEAALNTKSLLAKSLLGDVLLLTDCVQRDVLERTAEQQLVRRLVRFFDLPAGSTYRYLDGLDALADYGVRPARTIDPLALLWAGLSEHAERSTMMESTLARLGDKPMKLGAAPTASRFGLEGPEAQLLERLTASPATIAELCALGVAPLAAVRRFAYALLITRQLEGSGAGPLGASDSSRAPSVPGAGQQGASTAVARMHLKSTVHRAGAAAPDLPGAGEREPPPIHGRTSTRRMRALPPDPRAERADPPSTQVPPSSGERPRSDTVPPTERSSNIPEAPSPARSPKIRIEPACDSGVIEITATARDARGYQASGTLRSQAAPRLSPADAGIERSDISPGKSVVELLEIARARLAGRDAEGALVACNAAREDAPDDPDVIALSAWARVQAAHADHKAIAVELDELLSAHPEHLPARYYRAMVRKRLSNEAGARSDLRHLIEIDPTHEDAKRELAALEPKAVPRERPSLFGRLFKR